MRKREIKFLLLRFRFQENRVWTRLAKNWSSTGVWYIFKRVPLGDKASCDKILFHILRLFSRVEQRPVDYWVVPSQELQNWPRSSILDRWTNWIFQKKKRYVVGKKLYSVFSSRFSIRNHHAARLRVFSAATCIYSYERYSYDWITKGKTWNFQIEVTTDDKAKRNKIVDLTFAGLNYQPLWFLYTRVRGRKNVDDLAENTEHELFKTEKIKRWDDKGNRAGHKATSSVRFIGNVFGVVASQTLGANRRN